MSPNLSHSYWIIFHIYVDILFINVYAYACTRAIMHSGVTIGTIEFYGLLETEIKIIISPKRSSRFFTCSGDMGQLNFCYEHVLAKLWS